MEKPIHADTDRPAMPLGRLRLGSTLLDSRAIPSLSAMVPSPPVQHEGFAIALARAPLRPRPMADAPAPRPITARPSSCRKTDFPMKAGLPQKEPAILARWQEEDLYGQIRKRPRRPREVHLPRRPALRQRRHPHRPCAQPHAQGHGRPHPDPARQGRALRARLGLPRPADRVEGRGAVSQEEAQQGRGAGQGIPRRVPRLCPALGRRSARAVEAARDQRRLGQSLSDDGLSTPRRRSSPNCSSSPRAASSTAAPSR